MCANGSSRAPNLLRVRRTPLATARTSPWSRVSRVTIRSASPSLCWRNTTARSRYSRITIVLHPAATMRVSAPLVSYPVIGASGSAFGALSGSGSGSGGQRLPTLTDLLYQLASRAVTSTTLVSRSLHAIHASQPTLTVFRAVLTQSALAAAAAADRRRAAGDTAPLLGIPIAVKDDVDVAGVPTAFGTDGRVAPATHDAEVVRRLKAAGAVIVGKTNTCELGQWPFTSGPGFGHTRNPWSRRHTPGGSSGGRAAAVAAGLVTAAIGSDGAGSVRIPAAWTHLVGIKPQRGRISSWPLPEAFNGIAPGPLNIALSPRFPYTFFRAKLHPEILAATRAVGKQLELLGHTVVSGNPDYGLRLSWDFLFRAPAGLRDWEERLGDGVSLDSRTMSNLRMGHVLGQAILRNARLHETALQRRVGSIFDIVDVVLAPTTAQPPPLARAFDRLGGFGTDRAMIAACPLTFPWNVLGWPSINVPAGVTSDGLPIGVQLIGPANSEGMLISLAAELEAVCGWASKQPTVWWQHGPQPPHD